MGALVFTSDITEKINKLKEYARNHVFSVSMMKDILLHNKACAGDRPEFAISIPMGYRAVYNIEEQLTGDLYHHLSVLVDRKGKLPNQYAVEEIVKAFGIGDNLHDADNIWIEADCAINWIRKIDDPNFIHTKC